MPAANSVVVGRSAAAGPYSFDTSRSRAASGRLHGNGSIRGVVDRAVWGLAVGTRDL